ncbi:MAG: LCP family protein [Clostridia bacterium]|nr:LCP family protein [Clostridia bacterium]
MNRRIIFSLTLGAIALFLIVFGVFRFIEYQQAKKVNEEVKEPYSWDSRIVLQDYERKNVGGKTYAYKPGLTNILLLGVDTQGALEEQKVNRGNGQCDAIYLVTIDNVNWTVDILQLDRDTMTPITTTDMLGKPRGTEVAQICLSYSYGNGTSTSCQNAVEAVRYLLGGIPIDHVASINISAIEPLIDAIGGVKMLIETDMSDQDPALVEGETVTLNGHQAELYVRSRREVDDGRNASRMKRQRAFIQALMETVMDKLKNDLTDATTWYEAMEPYTYLDSEFTTFLSFFSQAADPNYTRHEIVTPAGEHDYTKDYAEFNIDKDALNNLILQLWYKEYK